MTSNCSNEIMSFIKAMISNANSSNNPVNSSNINPVNCFDTSSNNDLVKSVIQGLKELSTAAMTTAKAFENFLSNRMSKSYANAASCNLNELVFRPDLSKKDLNNKSNVQKNYSRQESNCASTFNVNANSFLNKLAELKNYRNEAAYKSCRNGVLIKLFTDNLKKQNARIPKKFMPTYNRIDPAEIREHKNAQSIQRVHEEIEKMKIHEKIQANKCEKFHNLAIELINTETDENKKQKYLQGYQKIIKLHDSKISKKLENKIPFFNSNTYMITLPTIAITNQTNVTNFVTNNLISTNVHNNQASHKTNVKQTHAPAVSDNTIFPAMSENTDEDDVSLWSPSRMSQESHRKRRAVLSSSSTSLDNNVEFYSSEPLNRCRSQISLIDSKNESVPQNRERKKTLKMTHISSC